MHADGSYLTVAQLTFAEWRSVFSFRLSRYIYKTNSRTSGGIERIKSHSILVLEKMFDSKPAIGHKNVHFSSVALDLRYH